MLERVRHLWIKHPWVIAFLLAPQFIIAPPANATGTVVFSALGIPCSQHTGADLYGHRYVAGTNGEITAINVLQAASVVNNSTYKANFPSSSYLIMANNGASAPNTILATFTADTMTGVNARFIGSYSITAGTKFWVVAGQRANVFPDCFNFSTAVPNANITFTKGWRLDTVTATSWPYVNGSTTSNLGSPTNSNMIFAISIELAVPAPATVSVSLQGGLTAASFRNSTPIRASASIEGKITFYQNGKVIAGCRNVQTASLIASCNWKPSVHGGARISATISPTDASIPSGLSPVFNVGVSARTDKR
jgi:hypothetical protein